MRVHFYTKYDRLGASSRYRTYQFLESFWDAGIETRTFPLFPNRYLEDLYEGVPSSVSISDIYWSRYRDLSKIGECDLAVVEKELFPYLPALMEKRAFHAAHHLLLDFDDAIFVKYQTHPRAVVRWFLGGKPDRLMNWSSGVICGNQFLLDYAEKRSAKAWLIPTTVDPEKYEAHDHQHEGLISIGWVGTPVTSMYLDLVREPIERLAKEVSLRFLVIGAPAPDWPGVETQSFKWSEEKEPSLIRWLDIGIMPLEDSPWEEGKCGLKLLQYMASEVVPVASDVGANREIVEDGVSGHLCKSPDDWFERLLELSRNPEKRAAMASHGRETVQKRYSLPIAAAKLIRIYHEAAGAAAASETSEVTAAEKGEVQVAPR